MRDVIEQGLGWAVVVGVVLAIILGRKRGQQTLSAAIAQAHAQGFAEGGSAAAAAHAQQSVMVAVDASRRDSGRGIADDHACDDPWSCVVCAPRLARIVEQQHRAGELTADRSAHDDGGTRVHGRGYFFDRTDTLGVPIRSTRTDERHDRVVDGGSDRGGVHESAAEQGVTGPTMRLVSDNMRDYYGAAGDGRAWETGA